MRLGGPVFVQTDDPRELARAHRRIGYRAAYCPAVRIDQTTRIGEIRQAFAAEDVLIAEVGAWTNLIAPDAGRADESFHLVAERLALADQIGAACCVDVIGSRHPDPEVWYGPHADDFAQDTFQYGVEVVRKLLDAVKPTRTKFALEMTPFGFADSPENCLRFLKAVDRPGFAMHLDVVNLVSCPRVYYATGKLVARCIDLLGPWIVSCHGKDIAIRAPAPAVQFDEVRPGQGGLDWRAYLGGLATLSPDLPLMLEHLPNEQEYTLARQHVQALARELGVEL